MSTGDLQTFLAIQTINAIKIDLVRISTPILLILGNFGEISSVIVFVQRTFRTNSCAIYLLAASCTRLVFINFTILLNGLTVAYSINPEDTSVVFCKIKYYIACVTTILPPSLVVLASIDRFMLSSRNAGVRAWSCPRIAYRLIAGVTIFWIVFSVHTLIGISIIPSALGAICYVQPGIYTLFVAIYLIIFNYSLPPILMVTFGLLTIANIRRTRRQIHPQARTQYAQRKDRYLLHMLFFQMLVNIICTIPAGVFQLYKVITENWQKDAVWWMRDVFFFILALFFFYIPNCIGFYIYTLTGSVFRQEFKRIIIKFYRRFRRQR